MRDDPPLPLIELLDRLGLATAEQIRAVAGRVRRLARDLPLFESVWVDALAQARVLTPFQAAWINAGRGPELAVGRYVLTESRCQLGGGQSFTARDLQTRRLVHLLRVSSIQGEAQQADRQLRELIDLSRQIDSNVLVPVEAAWTEGSRRVWAACAHTDGITAAEWMIRNGRFSPSAVLSIARQLASALASLERLDLIHGDISAAALSVLEDGHVKLGFPGLRPIVRRDEGYAHTDLIPEAYNYLAPERITEATPPNTSSDIYACGLLWWHLLTGRPPVAGGNSLAKLKAAAGAKIGDVRHLAPETPAPLQMAIAACTQRDPSRRPDSFKTLAMTLGPPTRQGQSVLSRCIAARAPWRTRFATGTASLRHSPQTPVWLAALAGCVIVVCGVTWPMWHGKLTVPLAQIWGRPSDGITESRLAESGASRSRSDATMVRGRSGHPNQRSVGFVRAERPATESKTGSFLKSRFRMLYDGPLRPSRMLKSAPPTASEGHRTSFETKTGKADERHARELLLPPGQEVPLEALSLRPGQTVRSADDGRARAIVPPSGFLVDVAEIEFRNIDFVASGSTNTTSRDSVSRAMIEIQAAGVAFRGCSFQTRDANRTEWAAIALAEPIGSSAIDQLPAVGDLRLTDCVLRGVTSAVELRSRGPLFVEFRNTLHLGPGPLVRVSQCPRLEESTTISLNRCTVRGATSLVNIDFQRMDEQPGTLTIDSSDSIFALRRGAPLIRCVGRQPTDHLLSSIRWTGQGSLLAIPSHFAAWTAADGRSVPLDDSVVHVDGLVSSKVQFQGPVGQGPQASRITHWSAPLKTDDPPGIRAAPLMPFK